MNLEQQVCSLPLAKRLKEIGIPQKSIFYHHWYKKNREWDDDLYYIKYNDDEKDELDKEFDDGKWRLRVYSAFTASELGEMLPWFIEKDNKTYWYGTGKTRKNDKYYSEHEIHYSDDKTTPCLQRDETEANARAKMLVYLIENGLIKNE